MKQKACTKGSYHVCPMYTGDTPHTGGPVLGGQQNKVLFHKKLAAAVGDDVQCNGPLDKISQGSSKVFICGKPAARVNDPCVHGGSLQEGEEKILLG